MSSCSCGLGGNSSIPKPKEEKIYANIETAFEPSRINKKKTFKNLEIFLILVIIVIIFMLIKDMKC